MQSLIVITFNSDYKRVADNIGRQLLQQGYKLNNYKEGDISDTIIIHSLNNLQDDFSKAVKLIKSNTKSVIIVKDSDLQLDKLIYKLFTQNDTVTSIKYDYDKTTKKLLSRDVSICNATFEIISILYSSGTTVAYIDSVLKDYGLSFKDFTDMIVCIKDNQKVVRLSDDTKRMIAERDTSGVTRKRISEELGINYKTIQRACKKFGIPKKNNGNTDEGDSRELLSNTPKKDGDTLICPKCNRKTNHIDERLLIPKSNRFYCKYCLEEYILEDNNSSEESLYRIKWETID